MRVLGYGLLAGLALAACRPVPQPQEKSQEWQTSTLSEQTLGKVRDVLRLYEQCVNDETRAHLNDPYDSRQVADAILQSCEDRLTGIRTAFDAEKVPVSISERYIRRHRSLAAQQILRLVMATQAVRAAQEKERKPLSEP